MHYLVTGGSGFIGSHLSDRLIRGGHEVTILDDFNSFYDPAIKHANIAGILSDITLVKGDIRNVDLVERTFSDGKFDSIIHLAARAGVRPSIQDPRLYLTTNIDGTFNILEACRNHGVTQFIFASSSSVYGINKKVPFAETDLIERTISPYAATKLAGEQICSNYSHLFGIRCMCLRFFTVYGPRQRPDLAISKFTKMILNGDPIDRYGDGSTARDYTYIGDIISGILSTIRHKDSMFDIFNLGGHATTTLNDLISMIEETVGKKAIINQLPDQPGDVPRTYADVDKAHRLLGYAPQTPIKDGLKQYADWVHAQQS